MNQPIDLLIHGYLDGTLTEAEESELNIWVKDGQQNARVFAEAVRLHDQLRGVIQGRQILLGTSPAACVVEEKPVAASKARRPTWRRFSAAGGLVALAAMVVLAFWFWQPAPASAQAELDRLIQSPAASTDRVYRISSPGAAPLDDGRQPPIDGAILSVRSPDKYVLERRFADGRKFITGSNGEHSWAIPPDGKVRVSRDPQRFRGPVPGHQHGIPFVDLRADLVELREAYKLTLLKPRDNGWRGLLAEKKSAEYRGPRRVEIWYDERSAVVRQMQFDGMPKARGGPDHVSMDLLEQRELASTFFDHQSHHGPERQVIEEE